MTRRKTGEAEGKAKRETPSPHAAGRFEEILRLEGARTELIISKLRLAALSLFFIMDSVVHFWGGVSTFKVTGVTVACDAAYLALAAALLVWLFRRPPGPGFKYAAVSLDLLFGAVYTLSYLPTGMAPDLLVGMFFSLALLIELVCGLRFSFASTIYAGAAGIAFCLALGALVGAHPEMIIAAAVMVGMAGAVSAYVSRRHLLAVRQMMERSMFERFLPRQVVDQFISGEHDTELGGREMEVTILFTDIRNFTALCEGMRPLEVLGLLNDYYTAVAAVIFRHSGMLDKFIGDAVMAVFGAPLKQPDDADRAAACAVEVKRVVARMNAERAARGGRPIDFGIGMHTGVVVAGNLGSPERMEYTVIGDTVNVASRVEGLTRKLGAVILATGSTRAALKGDWGAVSHGEFQVKGRAEPLAIWSLDEPGPATPLKDAD